MAAVPDETSWNSDYDGAWKDLLEEHLEPILGCFFPEVHAAIDWSQAPEYLEQELRNILANEEPRRQRLDELIKVQMRDGRSQWLLIHLEVQSFQEADFEKRIFFYFLAIQLAYREEVVSLVILGDLNPDWRPREYLSERLGCENRYRFVTCKLLDLLPRLEADYSLPAVAARLQIEGLRTTGDAEERYDARWRLLEVLYARGYSNAEAIAIYQTMIRMLRLPDELRLQFSRELVEWRKEKTMPFVGELEEYFLEQGQSRQSKRMVIMLMERLLGPVDPAIRTRVESLSTERTENLSLDLLEMRSYTEVVQWLDNERQTGA